MILRDKHPETSKDLKHLNLKENGNKYTINGYEMESLYNLREQYALELDNIHVYGNWKHKQLESENKLVKIDEVLEKPNIDYIENYTFNLIIESTNGEGCVSEKIFDAFVGDAIPIYVNRGNITKENILNIPTDCYIDAGGMSPAELNQYVKDISLQQIIDYKNNIKEKRNEILKNVSPLHYANKIEQILSNL